MKEKIEIEIREANPGDSNSITSIYNHYLRSTIITFETRDVASTEMESRMLEVSKRFPFLVATMDGKVIGYAYATAWKSREAYRQTVESSIYLHPEFTGLGAGKLLYSKLLQRLSALQVHCILAGIALPNDKSISFHKLFGFQESGTLKEVGYKLGRWVDVCYYQLIFSENDGV